MVSSIVEVSNPLDMNPLLLSPTLRRYSARQLTYHRDVLPALSGIAAAFQDSHLNTSTSREYSAGLWLQDIFHGLLWMTHDSSKARRVTEYLAPTWSWAAVIGHVQWPSRTIERHWQNSTAARFVDLFTELGAGGRMLSGRLVVRAKFHGPVSVVAPHETGALLRFPLDIVHDAKVIGNCAFDVDDRDGLNKMDLYVVQIRKQNPWDSNFPYHPSALLIRQRECVKAEYERVGCAALDEGYLDLFDNCRPTELTLV